ncbi:lysine-rich nucleolar protein 1 isoform X2 [Ascaphus truei]|uniref:lysine-rich nucleolar protein 1 isoform X2 n=1 Tax=Ascaphus truei TaxID=8439 RepID=UPI003F5A7B70
MGRETGDWLARSGSCLMVTISTDDSRSCNGSKEKKKKQPDSQIHKEIAKATHADVQDKTKKKCKKKKKTTPDINGPAPCEPEMDKTVTKNKKKKKALKAKKGKNEVEPAAKDGKKEIDSTIIKRKKKKKKKERDSQLEGENADLFSSGKVVGRLNSVSDESEPTVVKKKKKESVSDLVEGNAEASNTECVPCTAHISKSTKVRKKKESGRLLAEKVAETCSDVPGAGSVASTADVLGKRKRKESGRLLAEKVAETCSDDPGAASVASTADVLGKRKRKESGRLLAEKVAETCSDDPGTASVASTADVLGKRKRKESGHLLAEKVAETCSDDPGAASVASTADVLRKRKRKKDGAFLAEEAAETFHDDRGRSGKHGSKKQNKKTKGSGSATRKKKRHESSHGEDAEVSHSVSGNAKMKVMGSGCDPNTNGIVEGQVDDAGAVSKVVSSKKKRQHKAGDDMTMSLAGPSETREAASKSKGSKEKSKRKKVRAGGLALELPSSTGENPVPEEVTDIPRKKKKQRKRESVETTAETPRHKRKKLKPDIKCEAPVCNPDVEIISVKTGSSDEMPIDTVRRKALQEEVDRESGKIKKPTFGQWNTVSIECSDQQAKFFRLMGAFKKGNQGALPPSASRAKANMALGKGEEQVLNRNLQTEFDKALGWKQNRGIGLGYQPSEKKTFYIDKSISKSVKLEDC